MAQVESTKSSGRLTLYTGIGLALGVAVGAVLHGMAGSPAEAKEIAGYFTIGTDIFLRLIKMIIAPAGLRHHRVGHRELRRYQGGRPRRRPRHGLVPHRLDRLPVARLPRRQHLPARRQPRLPLPDAAAQTGLKAASINLREFITHVFPTSIVSAMATNEVLQILVFSVFFGFGLSAIDRRYADPMVHMLNGLAAVMFKVTDAVIEGGPARGLRRHGLGRHHPGLGVLIDYGKFIAVFYLGLAVLWALLIGAGWLVLGHSVVRLLRCCAPR